MINLLLKSAFRSLKKRKLNSLLSIVGLAIGFSTFIIVSLFIKYEVSWDKFNDNYENIYRIQTYKTVSDELVMQSSAAVSEHIKNNDYNDILNQSLVFPNWEAYLSKTKEAVPLKEIGQYADNNFLNIFSYDFISGNIERALLEPMSIVLSETSAKTLFGRENPIDKIVFLDKKIALKITGVYKDQPKNAHLRPAYIISINTLKTLWNNPALFDDWGNMPYYTYILTKENANIIQLETSLIDLMKDKLESDYRQLQLRPLADLYMYSTNDNYTIVLYLLAIFSFMVLVLAAINFMNLSIATGSLRGKEIGIKKVVGSNRIQLVFQIFIESFLITAFSVFVSILIVELVLNVFKNVIDKQMSIMLLLEDQFFLIVFASIFIVSIISSIYPSWMITSVSSLDLFKNKIVPRRRNYVNLKKYLVGFQFAISIGLITVAILMSRQIQHMYNQDLGFNKSQLLFVEMTPTEHNTTFSHIKNKLSVNSAIESVSISRGFPITSSRNTEAPMINREGGAREELIEVRSFWVSVDFVNTLDMEMVKGRDFSNIHPSDLKQGCLINETAVRHFGWDDPIGKYVDDKKLQVVGVFKDILFHDAYNQIKPLVLTLADEESIISGPVFFGARIKSDVFESAKSTLESTLKFVYPNDPFEVKRFGDHYAHDQIFKIFHSIKNIFIFFSVIGILLSVFGIIGLVNQSLTQRTKEIAIRKVSGCTSISIFRSLMMEYIIIILVAAIFGSMAAQYIFGKMPIYHPVDQNIFDYLIGIMIALGISMLAILFKTIRESTRNPVEALRYE